MPGSWVVAAVVLALELRRGFLLALPVPVFRVRVAMVSMG